MAQSCYTRCTMPTSLAPRALLLQVELESGVLFSLVGIGEDALRAAARTWARGVVNAGLLSDALMMDVYESGADPDAPPGSTWTLRALIDTPELCPLPPRGVHGSA